MKSGSSIRSMFSLVRGGGLILACLLLCHNAVAGEIITPQEEGSPSDDVFEPFDVSIGLDFGKSGYVLSEGENLPVIVKNNMDRFVDFEVALYVNCPEVSYQKKILYTSAYADKLSEAGVEVELRREHLLPNDNTLLCQIVPHVYAQNESGDLLKSIGTGVWIDPAQRQMKAYTQAQFDTLLKEKYNGGIPWRDMSTSRKDSIRKSGSRTSYVVNICAYWQTNYTDADASIGDDAYTSDGNKMARGVYMHIWKSGQTLFDGYTNISGCTGNLTVYSGTEYYLQMASVAELADSNRVVVYNDTDPADDSRSFSTVIYTLTPMVFTSGGTKNVNNGQLDPISNITAASAFAIYQHDGEMSTKTYTIKYSTESTWGNDCPGYVRLHTDYKKYIIAHELGHYILSNKRGGIPSFNYYYTPTQPSYFCGQDEMDGLHGITTEEYQSAALNEGWAHYYSAAIWNYESLNDDCKFKYYKRTDHDADGSATSNPLLNCEYGNYPAQWEWFNNYCNTYSIEGNEAGCANEWDWLAALWDLGTNYASIDFNDVLNTVAGISGSWSGSETTLYSRARTSANTQGILSQFDYCTEANGVDR